MLTCIRASLFSSPFSQRAKVTNCASEDFSSAVATESRLLNFPAVSKETPPALGPAGQELPWCVRMIFRSALPHIST